MSLKALIFEWTNYAYTIQRFSSNSMSPIKMIHFLSGSFAFEPIN